MIVEDSTEATIISWIRNTTIDPYNVQIQKFSWYCPFTETNWNTYTCRTIIPCSINQWKEYCEDKLQLATNTQKDVLVYWILAQLIVGITVTMDMYRHALLMK